MELGSDPIRQGQPKQVRRRTATSRPVSALHSLPTIESLEPRTLLSASAEPYPRFALVEPPHDLPALVLPLAVPSMSGASGVEGTANNGAPPVNASGPVVPVPEIHVIVLAPEAGVAAMSDAATLSGSSGDMHRTIDFGNMAPFRGANVPRPEVFNVDGQEQTATSSPPNDSNQPVSTDTPVAYSTVGYPVSLPPAPTGRRGWEL